MWHEGSNLRDRIASKNKLNLDAYVWTVTSTIKVMAIKAVLCIIVFRSTSRAQGHLNPHQFVIVYTSLGRDTHP
jgi:hypothetical protein